VSPRTAVLAGMVAAALAGCARPGPPNGGPEDTSAPRVVSVTPESLAVGVPTDTPITITFDEKLDKDRLHDALWIRPPNVIREVSFDGPTAVIRLRKPFPDSTTVGVVISTAVRDKRGNPLAAPRQWVFATGDHIAPGRVRGTLDLGASGAGRGQSLVALIPAGGDTMPDPDVVDPVAVTQAGPGGKFDIPGLPVDGKLYLAFAMQDRNEDRVIAGPGEFYSAAPESVRLTPDAPEQEVSLRLIDPEAPATVQGRLQRAEGDSTAVLVELRSAEDDSLGTVTSSATVKTDGGFSLSRVPPGVYRLVAVCDLDGSGKRDTGEPELVVRGGVNVPAGQTLDLGDLPGPRCTPQDSGGDEP